VSALHQSRKNATNVVVRTDIATVMPPVTTRLDVDFGDISGHIGGGNLDPITIR